MHCQTARRLKLTQGLFSHWQEIVAAICCLVNTESIVSLVNIELYLDGHQFLRNEASAHHLLFCEGADLLTVVIMQILTETVMKYAAIRWDCQESYMASQALYIFPKAHSAEGDVSRSRGDNHVTILAPPSRGMSSVPDNLWYIRWSNRITSSKFDGVPWLVTKFGNKTISLRTKQSERKLDSFARFLLWRSIVNCWVLWLRGAFLSGSIS